MEQSASRRRTPKQQTTIGGVVLAGVIALYALARPVINERMGWNLPLLPTPAAVEDSPREHSELEVVRPADQKPVGPNAPLVPKVPARTAAKVEAQPVPASKDDTSKLVHGLLKDLGSERYVSPAGLMYTRGGAEGHRLDHLERHTVDDPSRPGKHGVFDGGMEGTLKLIDRAYDRAKTGTRTTKEIDQGRTIYTVDMGSRVGFIGGQDGNRQKRPLARRVRIVLDQNRVITAYPL